MNINKGYKQKTIYDFLSFEQINEVPIVDLKEDVVFIPVSGEPLDLYYILKGKVEVYSHSYNGRPFLIDTIGENEFAGKFSSMRGHDFYAEIKTAAPSRLMKLTGIREELFNNESFNLFFHVKTTNRVYAMYKKAVSQMLFTQKELLAYYLLITANERGCIFEANENICLMSNISERQYYYIMQEFCKQGLLRREKKKIYITDNEGLMFIANNVTKFMQNKV